MKKKKMIIIALLVAVLGAAAGFFFVKRGDGGGDFPKPVEEYTAGTETVASITASIGEGKDEILLSVSSSEPTEEEKKAAEEEKQLSAEEKAQQEQMEQEAAKQEEEQRQKEEEKDLTKDEIKELEKKRKKEEKEQKKREKAEKKAQKKREKEEKKRQKATGETGAKSEKNATEPTTENLETWNKYYYKSNPHTMRVLKAYASYLEEQGFERVQGEQEAAQPKEQSKTASEEAQPNTFYGKYQKQSEDPGYLFSIELQYPLANDPAIQMYVVKAMKEKAPAEEDAMQGQGMTRDRALSYLESLDSTTLGLEKPLTDYYVVMDMGRSYVEGKDCYGINVYERGNEKESYFVHKYYMSISDQELYSCDAEGIIRRLYPAGATVPTEQTQGTSPTATQADTTNMGGTAHDWNFGPPDEKK